LDRVGQRTIGGYFDTEFVAAEKSDSTFKAHRVILEFSSRLHERLLFNSEIEFEYGGYVTNTDAASNVQKGEIKIEQAWFDYKISDALVQRTGIVVVPFGRVNVLHDSDVRDLTHRPLYAKKIVPTTWMDTGFGFHGVIDYGNTEINYQTYIINGLADTDGLTSDDISASNGIRKSRPNFKADNNGDKAFVGRVGVSPKLGLEIGASLYSGKVDDGGHNALTMYGVDGFYKKGRYEVVGEFAQAKIKKTGAPDTMYGGYLELRSHVLQDWLKEKTSFKSPCSYINCS